MRYALTFDDGPGPSTAAILDILHEAGVRATFFVLGRNVAEAPWANGDAARAEALVVRALREGHVIGNHSWSHGRPPAYLGLADDLARCDAAIRRARQLAGVDDPRAPIPVRLPYGVRVIDAVIPVDTGTAQAFAVDPRLAVLASLGRTHVHWTCELGDWALPAYAGPDLARRMIEHVAHNSALGLGAVIDLHDGGTGSSADFERPATVHAVRSFLEHAAARGWESFVVPGG